MRRALCTSGRAMQKSKFLPFFTVTRMMPGTGFRPNFATASQRWRGRQKASPHLHGYGLPQRAHDRTEQWHSEEGSNTTRTLLWVRAGGHLNADPQENTTVGPKSGWGGSVGRPEIEAGRASIPPALCDAEGPTCGVHW